MRRQLLEQVEGQKVGERVLGALDEVGREGGHHVPHQSLRQQVVLLDVSQHALVDAQVAFREVHLRIAIDFRFCRERCALSLQCDSGKLGDPSKNGKRETNKDRFFAQRFDGVEFVFLLLLLSLLCHFALFLCLFFVHANQQG